MYLQKMPNCHVTFTYLSSDSEMHKLSANWLSIPQKIFIIWTAVLEVWIRWSLSLPTIPSSSKRSLGSQMLNPCWSLDLCIQELTYRISLLLSMSCSFTNKMEKKPLGPPHPPSLLLPDLNSCFGYTRSLCLSKMKWLIAWRPDEPQLIPCNILILGTQAKQQISRAEMQVVRCCFLQLISAYSFHLTHTFLGIISSPIFRTMSKVLWRLISMGEGGFFACWQKP